MPVRLQVPVEVEFQLLRLEQDRRSQGVVPEQALQVRKSGGDLVVENPVTGLTQLDRRLPCPVPAAEQLHVLR